MLTVFTYSLNKMLRNKTEIRGDNLARNYTEYGHETSQLN